VPTDPTNRGEARRAQLLEAALRVIARGGVGAATHRAVAAEADVPLGSTTYYFASREDMVAQALELVVGWDRTALDNARDEILAAATAPKPLAEAISRTLLRGLGDDEHVWVAGYELLIEASRRPELRELNASWTNAEIDVIAPALERLGTRDPQQAARLLVAALNGLALEVLAHGGRAELPGLVEDLVRRVSSAS
jgi:DNA-binding transcriptional regulator YbjK